MRTDIVIQDVAAFRIDPAVLRRPDRDTVLVTSRSNHAKLVTRGREDAFDSVVVLDSFTTETLSTAVAAVRRHADDPEDVRLLCHDEYSLAKVAAVRELLGIPGPRPHQLAPFADKLTMKRNVAASGVDIPAHLRWRNERFQADPAGYLETVEEHVGLPCVVKPVDESGAVGVQKIQSRAGLWEWARTEPPGQWEVDSLVTGTLYHVDSLVRDDQVLFAAVNEDLHPCADYAEGRLNASWTVDEDDPVHARLIAFNRQVLDALPKPDAGVFHHEIFRTPADELVFLEIAARPPAALIPHTSRIRFGFNIEEAHFRLQRGEQVMVPAARGPYAAYAFVPKVAGRLVERHRPDLSSDHRWQWNVEVGEEMAAPENIRDFAASVLLWSDSLEELTSDLRMLDSHPVLWAVDGRGEDVA